MSNSRRWARFMAWLSNEDDVAQDQRFEHPPVVRTIEIRELKTLAEEWKGKPSAQRLKGGEA